MTKHPFAARILGALRACALVVAAAALAACETTVMVPEDAGWEPDTSTPIQAFRYVTHDVEVVAERTGGTKEGPPTAILGTIFAFGGGPMDAEFLPPFDGVGGAAVRVVVPSAPSAPGAPDVQEVPAAQGRRFALAAGAPGAPASLSFAVPVPAEPDTLTVSEHPVVACTILLRGDGYSLAIPFRFSLRKYDPTSETWTFLLLIAALAGVVIWANSGSFVVVSF